MDMSLKAICVVHLKGRIILTHFNYHNMTQICIIKLIFIKKII